MPPDRRGQLSVKIIYWFDLICALINYTLQYAADTIHKITIKIKENNKQKS